MGDLGKTEFYDPVEERWNVWTHGLGLVLSFAATFLLVVKALSYNNLQMLISFSVFGFSLILLYSASTFYHRARNPVRRFRLKICDHIAIFLLIAGTYTPFSLVTLKGSTGWIIFGVAWGIALLGTILKIFFTGRFKILSTLLYVGMGWIIVFAMEPLIENFSEEGLWWLFAGGLSYTLGAVLYNINRLKFNHAIFHFFVLGGSFCHFISIYSFVRP